MKSLIRSMLLVGGLFTMGVAQAHPGHDVSGVVAGALHPLSGIDHLLAMLAVGMWAALFLQGAKRWLAPLAFMASMLVGAGLAYQGINFVGSESLVAMSVVFLGAMLCMGDKLPRSLGLLFIVMAGVAHGSVHGMEISGQNVLAYTVGFLLSTAALHVIGIVIGREVLSVHHRFAKLIGVVVSGVGVVLALA